MPKERDLIVGTSFRLQTILRSILGFVHIIGHEKFGEELNAEQRELVKRLDLSIKSWEVVTKNLREFSGPLNEKSDLDENTFDLRQQLQLMEQHLTEPIKPTYTMISISLKLIKTSLPEQMDDFVKTIYSNAIQLQRVINNLQDFHALKDGRLTLKQEPFHLRKWIEALINLFTPEARGKGVSISCVIDTQVPKQVIGDALRLYQILYNLLDNALKFTHQGQITLSINNLSPNNQEQCELHFAMQDTGIGIFHETIDYLFSTYQSPWALSCHRYQPKGLGLPLNKELVELMDGKIWVESKTRTGSTFHFTATFAQVML